MSLATEITPHLPYLRRYARALTGDQQSGDAYVAALLEAIIADPDNFERTGDTRITLYGAFCKLWESVSLNLRATPESPDWKPQPSADSPP